MESKEKLGFAPAAIVLMRNESTAASSMLRSIDINRQPRPSTPIVAARKSNVVLKENENPDTWNTPYQAIVTARDSLRQREETSKMKSEIQKLDDEMNQLKHKTEEEKIAIEDLEKALVRRKRKAEKCRRLAEAQSSYRTMLEKMIRDAMHQSVVYKEQVRLNQAAASALMATLEAQRAMCDSAEKELFKKYKQRDDLEKQIMPEWEQARKRSRLMTDALYEETESSKMMPSSSAVKPKTPLHKQLRVFLEEEQKLSEAVSLIQVQKQEEKEGQEIRLGKGKEKLEENKTPIYAIEYQTQTENQFDREEAKKRMVRFALVHEPEMVEDEESRKERGKGQVEKWLQMLLGNTKEGENVNFKPVEEHEIPKTDEIYHQKEIQVVPAESRDNRQQRQEEERQSQRTDEIQARKPRSVSTPRRLASDKGDRNDADDSTRRRVETRKSPAGKEKAEKGSGKDGSGLTRSENARTFRRIPSSPSIILGMKKGVDCMRKKPMVIDDDDDSVEEKHVVVNSFFKSPLKAIKKAVKM